MLTAACTTGGSSAGSRATAAPRPAASHSATTPARAASPAASPRSVQHTRAAERQDSQGPSRLARLSAGTRPATGTVHIPLIVIDPGHSVAVSAIDPRTGLNVSDYENEPEMRDVFAVAQLVAARLRHDGYRVVMTKRRVDQPASLAQRAYLAKRLHADLALSIHDQAGANGGIPFNTGNNIVYYQSVGTYRATASGRRVYFSDKRVAAVSKRYGAIFRRQRQLVEHHYVRLQGNVGYNLGSRGLAAGNIWIVQLLSDVPWIYNEAGGNSAGRIGLSIRDEHRYAAGLIASVEHCIAPPQ
jgi:N-acetylmuramoyl-L-alanine amidase